MQYRQFLKDSKDLITTYEQIRAGFVSLALERNRKATPFVEEARALRTIANTVNHPRDLLEIESLKTTLLTAAGISGKASNYLQESDKIEAIEGLINNFLEPAGEGFVEELIYRFLLTKGDTLGGTMRNIGGFLAQRKLSRSILSALTLHNINYQWLDANSNRWLIQPEDNTDIELNLKGLTWKSKNNERTLIYNITVPIVKKNIDICLFNCLPENINKSALKNPDLYIALGELKGGIDPAGADEHWKTANSALERIRKAFNQKNAYPNTFFIGAAIVENMAQEIWQQLEKRTLNNAANLTKPDQITAICTWLIDL